MGWPAVDINSRMQTAGSQDLIGIVGTGIYTMNQIVVCSLDVWSTLRVFIASMVSSAGLMKLQGSVKASSARLSSVMEQHVKDKDTFDMQAALQQFALEIIFGFTYGVQMPTKSVRLKSHWMPCCNGASCIPC
jgi:hypothetical protein